jgi:hypothetical protein
MPKPGSPLPRLQTDLKLAVRIHKRYLEQGEAAGLAYAVGLVRTMPHLADKLYALMPAPRAQTIREEVARQRAAKTATHAAAAACVQALHDQATAAEQTRLAALTTELEAARQAGTAVAYLAGVSPHDRDQLATKEERREAIALRKTGMLKGKVLVALGCTATELERWHADGRLPHLYTRVLALAVAGKAQPCRVWAQDVVTAAQTQVPHWRALDQAQPRGRSGLYPIRHRHEAVPPGRRNPR